jgi:hypothetical protein
MARIKNLGKMIANTSGLKNNRAMGMRLSRNQSDAGQQGQVQEPNDNQQSYVPSPVKRAVTAFYAPRTKTATKKRLMKVGQI